MYYIPNKLLYIAIPKTGSTAITNHLNEIFDYKGVKCIETESEDCSWHPTIWDIGDEMANDNFFFTVVRNPYSRFVSHYFYSLYVIDCWDTYNSTPYGKSLIDRFKNKSLAVEKIPELESFKESKPFRKDIHSNLYLDQPTNEYFLMKEHISGTNSLEDYAHKLYEEDIIQKAFAPQVIFTHFSWNYNGPKMDFIGKMEDLQGSCDYICKELDIDSKKLPYLNKGKHKHWSEYYNHDTKKLIGQMYDIDFKYFGYKK